MIKLYYAPRTRATRPRWLLEELEVPYELIRLDLAKGEHKRPEYLAVHPHGVVPALQDGNLTLMESLAICMYLADKFPEKKLAPAVGTPERGQYYQWIVYAVASIEPPLLKVFTNTAGGSEKDRSTSEAEAARKQFGEVAQVLKKALAGKSFLVGDSITAADIVIGSLLAWSRSMGLLKDHADLEEYVKRLADRPAFRRAQA